MPQETSEEKLRRECLSVSNAANELGKLKTNSAFIRFGRDHW